MAKRKAKQIDIEEAIDASAEKNGHNGPPELTEDERRALHYRHCREYEVVLAAKKKSDADLKNVAKRIKAESDSVAKVKKTIQARSAEGEADLKAEIAETAEVLRWAGTSVGETVDLFPVDRAPSVDRAHAEGKRAGLNGETCKPPHDPSVPQYKTWMEGWHEGQAALASAFEKQGPTEDVAVDLPAADTSSPPFSAASH